MIINALSFERQRQTNRRGVGGVAKKQSITQRLCSIVKHTYRPLSSADRRSRNRMSNRCKNDRLRVTGYGTSTRNLTSQFRHPNRPVIARGGGVGARRELFRATTGWVTNWVTFRLRTFWFELEEKRYGATVAILKKKTLHLILLQTNLSHVSEAKSTILFRIV